MRQLMGEHAQITARLQELGKPLSPYYTDFITGLVKLRPVLTSDRRSYDEYSIKCWLTWFKSSPVTGRTLNHIAMREDRDTREIIAEHLAGCGVQGVPAHLCALPHSARRADESDESMSDSEKSDSAERAPADLMKDDDAVDGPQTLSQRLVQLEDDFGLSLRERLRLRHLFDFHCQHAPRNQHPPPPPDLTVDDVLLRTKPNKRYAVPHAAHRPPAPRPQLPLPCQL